MASSKIRSSRHLLTGCLLGLLSHIQHALSTDAPTASPHPSTQPSISAEPSISTAPSFAPSTSSSPSMTISPSTNPSRAGEVVGPTTFYDLMITLEDDNAADSLQWSQPQWELDTAEYIQEYFNNEVSPVFDVDVSITVTSFMAVDNQDGTGSSVTITYNQMSIFKTVDTASFGAAFVVQDPFTQGDEQSLYVRYLKDKSSNYDSISSVSEVIMPSEAPSSQPSTSLEPSSHPSLQPSSMPSSQPSEYPSSKPSISLEPTHNQSASPSSQPSLQPSSSQHPSPVPFSQPSTQPSNDPSNQSSSKPTFSNAPSSQPSTQPSSRPSASLSSQPSSQPSFQPTTSSTPSPQPVLQFSSEPSSTPSSSQNPSSKQSSRPSSQPSMNPSTSSKPSSHKSDSPSSHLSSQPTLSKQPSSKPSSQPSSNPSSKPSSSLKPSPQNSVSPSSQPSSQPSSGPSSSLKPLPNEPVPPSSAPSLRPSSSQQPSSHPFSQPSTLPSSQPSSSPSSKLSSQPSSSQIPSSRPTAMSSHHPSLMPTPTVTSQPTIIPTGAPSTPNPTISSKPSTSMPTGPPTLQPTPSTRSPVITSEPTKENTCGTNMLLTVDVVTDNFAGETSWTLTNTCTQTIESSIPHKTLYRARHTPYSVTLCVPSAAYDFTIKDTFGDGMCCGWGDGSYTVTYDGAIVASGGNFEKSESTQFGSCDAVTVPTPRPTALGGLEIGNLFEMDSLSLDPEVSSPSPSIVVTPGKRPSEQPFISAWLPVGESSTTIKQLDTHYLRTHATPLKHENDLFETDVTTDAPTNHSNLRSRKPPQEHQSRGGSFFD